MTRDQAVQLDKLATIAPFGKGNKTVYDPKYRKAMEITPDRFTITPNPIMDSSDILDQIAKTSHMNCKLRAVTSKPNIYTEGGFFKRHCDTPKSTNHIGTIVLGLPGAYSGGQLVVGHGGSEITFDWGMPRHEFERGTEPSTGLQWAFLYGDCEYRVKKVHAGARLTIAYDVYTVPEARRKTPKNQSQSDKLYNAFQAALNDRVGFAKNGCVLAFGLSHSYPKTTESLWKGLEGRLKGADAVLLQAVNRCGLKYSFKAAFSRNWVDEGRTEAETYGIGKKDQLSETTLNALYRNGMKKFQVIITDKPDAAEGQLYDTFLTDGDHFLETLDRDQAAIQQLVWVSYPESYGFKNNYGFIGNGPVDDCKAYSGVVVLINIPPGNDR